MACTYDINVVIPLLMLCFDRTNPITSASIVTTIGVVGLILEENMFGVGASIEESSLTLVT
jgi:hypothetical protein